MPATIRVLIRIPLTSSDETFDIYKVIPFPTKLPTDMYRMKLVTNIKRVAMTPTKTKFTVLDDDALKSCIRGNVLICPKAQAYMVNPARHCLFAMLTDKTPRYEFRCDYMRLTPTETEVLPLTSVTWAVSAIKKETFQVSCMSNLAGRGDPILTAVRSIEITGNAMFHLPMHCQAQSEDWELPLRLDTIGSTDLALSDRPYYAPPMPNEYELIDPPEKNITVSNEFTSLLQITHAYLKSAATSPNGTLDPQIMDNALKEFREELKFRYTGGLTTWRVMIRILQGIGFILLVIAIYYLRQRCKNAGANRNAMIFEPIPMVRRSRRRHRSASPTAV